MEEGPFIKKQEKSNISTWNIFKEELKTASIIALPMVVMTVSNYMSRIVSMMMVGHIGDLALSGCSVATSLTNVLGLSVLIVLHTVWTVEWVGNFVWASLWSKTIPQARDIYIWSNYFCSFSVYPNIYFILLPGRCAHLFRPRSHDFSRSREIRDLAYTLPSLFPSAIVQPLTRYLQMQSLITTMVLFSVAALIFQIPVCWAFVYKFELGIAGAALSICLSSWLNLILIVLYVKYSSSCETTRITFSPEVFPSMGKFMKLAIPSALMVCLEWWVFEVVVLLSGLMSNPKLETSVLSIGLMIASVHYFLPFSIGTAASIRVSNELGAGNSGRVKMIVLAVMSLAILETTICITILLCIRNTLGSAFSDSKDVVDYLGRLMPFICVTLLIDCFQAVLSGVARGTGWQHIGAYINFGSYYVLALPVVATLGFGLHLRGTGLWLGLNAGSVLQAILFCLITCFTDWKKQALMAKERVFADVALGPVY